MPAIAVELRGLSKRFGDCVANERIDLHVRSATIHAIVGENGAGKSTAMKMLYGMYPPDSGEVIVRGERREWRGPRDAIAAGLGMVHQHFMLAGPYTALENIVLGAESGRASWLPLFLRPVDLASARKKLEALGRQYGLEIDLDAPIERLPVGVQQRIEILKALYRDASILILDEPTAVLTPQETQALFANFRRLRDEGKTVIIITHKLGEVMELSSQVTVFRAGRVVGERETVQTTVQDLADLMVGRKVSLTTAAPPPQAPGAPVLEVRELSTGKLDRVSLTVRAGEIVGIAGVEGNGQDALLGCVIRPHEMPPEQGRRIRYFSAEKGGAETTACLRREGMAVIPSDRHHEAVLLGEPLVENMILGFSRDSRYRRGGFLARSRAVAETRRILDEYDVRPRMPEAIMDGLSGGNQQKFVVGRELRPGLKLLVVAQPTRGVDVGAIELIHRRILDARAAGVGVLLVSSELSEVMSLSDRILVMYRGRIVREFTREYREQELGVWMGGGPKS